MAQVLTLNGLIDKAHTLREEIREKEAELKEVSTLLEATKLNIIERLQQEGLDRAAGQKASVTLSVSTVPQFDTTDPNSWSKFESYVYRYKALSLLERRLSTTGWREIKEQNRSVPGVTSFSKVSLRMVNLKEK